jgi:hypothetical protein
MKPAAHENIPPSGGFMHKAVYSLAALTVFVSAPLLAQEDREAAFVYEAYYAIEMSETEEWNRQYREYSVPVLRQLVEEGVIEGFNQMQHHTGGDDYNYRFVIRTYDWPSIDVFWSEYISRLEEATPADAWAASNRSVAMHRDEIWDIDEMGWSEESGAISHMYASTFRVNFQDMGEWNESWDSMMRPVLDEAVDEGMLLGWVKLDHNTGGPHNAKVMYFVDDWDKMDDFFQKAFASMGEDEAAMMRFAGLMRAHDDDIWVPVPTGDM